jgi:DNA-binding NarL/FixJ family response regulator
VRIVIGEDSALFREGLASLLHSAGHEVVGRAATAAAAVSQVRAHLPDAVVLDIRMPSDDEGIVAALEIREWVPTMPIMLLSQHIEARRTLDLISSGAIGYLLKDRVLDVDEFLSALGRVAAGGTAMDGDVVARLLGAARVSSVLDSLTPRELDVLSLMAQGWSNAASGRRLFLSERTIETHCGGIFAKLDLTASADENRRVRAILTYLDAAG